MKQKELALEKLRFDDHRAQEKLADLEKDLTLMTIKAPAAGVVYHGRYSHGQWTSQPATAYLKGGTLPANDVVLTIVSNGRLFVHTEVEEKDMGDVKVGQAARFAPTRSPQQKLAGKVHRVAAIPQSGKFEVIVALADETPDGIVPGLTGSVKIVTARKAAALTVASSAVFEDADDDSHHVYLPGKPPQKKTVQIGLVVGDKTEIVEGLAAVLIAMYEANRIGVAPPEKLLQRALKMTKAQRLPDGSYMYGYYLHMTPTHPVNRPGGVAHRLAPSRCGSGATARSLTRSSKPGSTG